MAHNSLSPGFSTRLREAWVVSQWPLQALKMVVLVLSPLQQKALNELTTLTREANVWHLKRIASKRKAASKDGVSLGTSSLFWPLTATCISQTDTFGNEYLCSAHLSYQMQSTDNNVHLLYEWPPLCFLLQQNPEQNAITPLCLDAFFGTKHTTSRNERAVLHQLRLEKHPLETEIGFTVFESHLHNVICF